MHGVHWVKVRKWLKTDRNHCCVSALQEHVFWVVSLNTLFILVFGKLTCHVLMVWCTVQSTITFWICQVFKGMNHFWSRLSTDSDLTSLFLSSVLPVSHWSFLSGWTGLRRLCKCTVEHDGHFYSFGWVGILWWWKFIIIMLYLVTDQSFTLWRPHHHHTGVHPPGWSSHHLPCIQSRTCCSVMVV